MTVTGCATFLLPAGALAEHNLKPCIPGRANRKAPVIYDTELYKSLRPIERLFGSLTAHA
jgi:hypothetical protein